MRATPSFDTALPATEVAALLAWQTRWAMTVRVAAESGAFRQSNKPVSSELQHARLHASVLDSSQTT